jgi:hypothetical protein
MICLRYPSQHWIKSCRKFSFAVAGCVAVIMVLATREEEADTVGINLPLYMSQDALRILVALHLTPSNTPQVCVCALAISKRHHRPHHARMLTELSQAQRAHALDQAPTAPRASCELDLTEPLQGTAAASTPRRTNFAKKLRAGSEALERPGRFLWTLVVIADCE